MKKALFMANLDNDDLDALLDDCMTTLEEQERVHEEKVKEREAVRAAEPDKALIDSDENSYLMRAFEDLMKDAVNDPSADPDVLIEKLKEEITRTAALVESMPDATDEDRASLMRVRQLFDMLSCEALAEEKGGGAEEDKAPNGEKAKEEAFEETLQRLLAETGRIQEGSAGGDLFSPAVDGPAAAAAAAAADRMDSLGAMLVDFLMNPQLLEPFKLMRDSYPRWMAANASSTSAEDMERYKKQHELSIAICDHIGDGSVDRNDEGKADRLLSLMHEFTSLAPLPPGLDQSGITQPG